MGETLTPFARFCSQLLTRGATIFLNSNHALAIEALDSLKAQDLVSIDMRRQSEVIDCMIVCTGTSNRHVKSLANNLIQQAKQAKLDFILAEGIEQAEWVLVDLGDTIAHIMLREARDYYQIERLWQPFAKQEFNPAIS